LGIAVCAMAATFDARDAYRVIVSEELAGAHATGRAMTRWAKTGWW
jgi:hypothetical protein